jgi:hypothetical protein
MSQLNNPAELVDRYLQAVRFWLPKTEKREGLIAELGDDLRSQVEGKEAEFARPLDKSEVSEILKRCGSPMTVATRLGPHKHLIGPTLYPVYILVLKMALLWILVPVFVFIVGPVNVTNSGENWGTAIANTLGDLWPGLFIAAGTITVVFAILERTHAHAAIACKWDPLSLPPVRKQERKGSPVHAICELVFGFFGLIWLLLLPQYPILIVGSASNFLKAGPIVHAIYVPLVLLAATEILRPAITLVRIEWAWFPPLAAIVQAVFSLILLNFVIDAAISDSHPFIVLAAGTSSAHYAKVVTIVNASILISLYCAWIGLGIVLVVQTWRLLCYRRKRVFGGHHAESLPVH